MGSEISIVILNYNNAKETQKLVERIHNYQSIRHIVIVDNFSTDNSFKQLSKINDEKTKLISSGSNKGYGYGNNCGIKFINSNFKSDYIIICNPDVIFEESIVISLKEILNNNPNAMIASGVMSNENGEEQKNTAWKLLPCLKYVLNEEAIIHRILKLDQYKDLLKSKGKSIKKVDCLAGSFFMIRNTSEIKKGIYDEHMFLYCEENYLGLWLRKNNYISLLLNDFYIHKQGTTINKKFTLRSKQDSMIFENELYLMKKYMKASKQMLFFSKFFFDFCIFERFTFRFLTGNLKGNITSE